MNPEKLFSLTENDILCNTSYPLKPKYFSRYRTDKDIMNDSHELSFYFHVPFCKSLCAFCEYTRFISKGNEQEDFYVSKMIQQAEDYITNHDIRLLHGLDIGGGTPTALNLDALTRLLKFAREIVNYFPGVKDFMSSIEFSFSTVDESKIKAACENGVSRMSAGLQVFDNGLMTESGRINPTLERMIDTFHMMRALGVRKINLDIMYGFTRQTQRMLDNTLRAIDILRPEHVTFYEMRYNANHLGHDKITRESLYQQYAYLYGKIISLGYAGNFGGNTFSLCGDLGVSSYLRSRMCGCIPYKGFGVSAQSMSRKGISYNILKSEHGRSLPDFEAITEGDIYLLPPDETAAKYVCIALYSGQFSMKTLTEILNDDAYDFYRDEIDFLASKRFIEIHNDICRITSEGFKVYGAVASLFWSEYHKHEYIKEV